MTSDVVNAKEPSKATLKLEVVGTFTEDEFFNEVYVINLYHDDKIIPLFKTDVIKLALFTFGVLKDKKTVDEMREAVRKIASDMPFYGDYGVLRQEEVHVEMTG